MTSNATSERSARDVLAHTLRSLAGKKEDEAPPYYVQADHLVSTLAQAGYAIVPSGLVAQLRADLLKFCEDEHIICEGCGAPISLDEEAATVADVRGCWGYVSDAKGTPCFRYRTSEGVERAWPECAMLKSHGGGDG